MSYHKIPYQYGKKSPETIPNTIMSSAMYFLWGEGGEGGGEGLKNDFEIAVVNEQSGFKPRTTVFSKKTVRS